MFAEKSHVGDHTCALERDKTKVAKSFPRALPFSPGGFTRTSTPTSSAPAVGRQLVTAPTNLTASPGLSPTLPSPRTSSALPLSAWTPPGLPSSALCGLLTKPPHHSVCDIPPGAVTFPISEPDPHPPCCSARGLSAQPGWAFQGYGTVKNTLAGDRTLGWLLQVILLN